MNIIFVDSVCPACGGDGCEKCDHYGTVGHCEEREIKLPTPTPWSRWFGAKKVAARLTLAALHKRTGIEIARLSSLHNGTETPTDEEKTKIAAAFFVFYNERKLGKK